MITGLDIRRYRELIGLNQRTFAEKIGLTQSALSLMEIGKQSLSEQHLDKIAEAFESQEFDPRFSAFRRSVEEEMAQGQGTLSAPLARFLTLPVYRWEPGFDLSRPVHPDNMVGLVSVPFAAEPAIAFSMSQRSEAWLESEILVFRRCGRDDLKDNDLCLAQVRSARGNHTKTLIAQVHVSRAVRGGAVHLEPLSPAGPIFPATNESIIAYLRATYRAREIA